MIEKGIAVIGSTTIDEIIHRNFSRFKIGGVTTYSGITYSRHGIKTCVLTNVANRDREIIKRLKQESIVVCPAVSEHLPAAIRVSHIVKANRQEYESLIDFFRTDLTELMRQFKINEFVVTSGHKGGFVQTITGEEIPYPAASVKSNGDPTGAGDIFLAAYVIDRFYHRRSIRDACQYAAKLAARQIGGNYIQPDDLSLEDWKKHRF